MIVLPVSPVDQLTVPTQPMADKLIGVPIVTGFALACRLSTGWGSTVTVPTAKAVEPVEVVQVAV